eukprot:gene8243-5764_t
MENRELRKKRHICPLQRAAPVRITSSCSSGHLAQALADILLTSIGIRRSFLELNEQSFANWLLTFYNRERMCHSPHEVSCEKLGLLLFAAKTYVSGASCLYILPLQELLHSIPSVIFSVILHAHFRKKETNK